MSTRKRGFHFREIPVDDTDPDPWPRMAKPAAPGIAGNLRIKTKGVFAKWKMYYFVVKDGDLCYYANAMDSSSQTPVGRISIRDSQAIVAAADNLTGKSCSFVLCFPLLHTSVYLCAPTIADMQAWMTAISSLAGQVKSYDMESMHNYVEAISDAAVMSDATGIIVAWNRAAENMFGWTAEEAKGKNVNIVIPERWRVVHNSCVLRYQYTGERRLIGVPRKLEAIRKDGTSIMIEISLGEVPSAVGSKSLTDAAPDPKAPRWMALFRDVSGDKSTSDSSDDVSELNDLTSDDNTTSSEIPDSSPEEPPQIAKCPFHNRAASCANNSTMESMINPHTKHVDLAASRSPDSVSSSRSSSDLGQFTDSMRKSVNDLAQNIITTLLGNVQELQDRYDDLQQRLDFLDYENKRLRQVVVESQLERQKLEKQVQEYKLQLTSSHIEQLLHDKDTFAALLDFAKREHTEENLLFWRAAEAYRQTQYTSDLPQVARSLYSWYVQQDAPHNLNITNEAREEVSRAINSSNRVPLARNLFDTLQRSIFFTIRDDIWPRFLKTDAGKSLQTKFPT